MKDEISQERMEAALNYVFNLQDDIKLRQCSNSMRVIIGNRWTTVNGSITQAFIELVEAIQNDKRSKPNTNI